MMIRSFISINLPDEIKKRLSEIISDLKKHDADIKWVSPDSIHLTLKFLGNIEASIAATIIEKLQKKIASYEPFYIKIAGVGCFPSEKRPRVIWVGIEGPDTIRRLQTDIETEMSGLGFEPEDRPFSPHLTIGRVRSMRGMAGVMNRFRDFSNADLGSMEVSGIHLMKSDLKPSGAIYSVLGDIQFNKGRTDVKQGKA